MKKVFHLMAVFAIALCSMVAVAAVDTTDQASAALAVSLEPSGLAGALADNTNAMPATPDASHAATLAGFVTGRTCCTKSVDAMLSAGPDDDDDDAGGDAHDGMAGGPSFRDIAGRRT